MSSVNELDWKQDLARGAALGAPPTAWLIEGKQIFLGQMLVGKLEQTLDEAAHLN